MSDLVEQSVKEHALKLEFHVGCDPLCLDGRRLLERTPAKLHEAADELARLRAALAEAERLAETLKQQGQSHAQEARTANSTIAEIYQACSGAKGEPGNWNGAQPVIATLQATTARAEAAEAALVKARDWLCSPLLEQAHYMEGTRFYEDRATMLRVFDAAITAKGE